jgi:hypothetical protein
MSGSARRRGGHRGVNATTKAPNPGAPTTIVLNIQPLKRRQLRYSRIRNAFRFVGTITKKRPGVLQTVEEESEGTGARFATVERLRMSYSAARGGKEFSIADLLRSLIGRTSSAELLLIGLLKVRFEPEPQGCLLRGLAVQRRAFSTR